MSPEFFLSNANRTDHAINYTALIATYFFSYRCNELLFHNFHDENVTEYIELLIKGVLEVNHE